MGGLFPHCNGCTACKDKRVSPFLVAFSVASCSVRSDPRSPVRIDDAVAAVVTLLGRSGSCLACRTCLGNGQDRSWRWLGEPCVDTDFGKRHEKTILGGWWSIVEVTQLPWFVIIIIHIE